MNRSAARRLLGMTVLALCLSGEGISRTRLPQRSSGAVKTAEAQPAAEVARMQRWHRYWRRMLPLWGGMYLVTLLGVLSIGTYLHRMETVARTEHDPVPSEKMSRHDP